jgi:PAS domain S-box-containing protein
VRPVKHIDLIYSVIENYATDGVYLYDIKKDYTYLSDRWKSLLGYEAKELSDEFHTWEKLLHPGDFDRITNINQQLIKGEINSIDMNFRMIHKNGKTVHIMSKGQLIRDEHGEPNYVIGIHQDISEIRKKELNYDTVLNFIPESILVLKEQKIMYINDNGKELLGLKDEGFIPEKILDALNPVDRGNFISGINDIMLNDNLKIHNDIKVKRRGEIIYLETFTKHVRYSGEDCILIILRDISYRKYIEEELNNKNEQLTMTLNNLQSTQNQLIRQEKLAGLGQLAAGIAHEINNPLGYIISNFETLKTYVSSFDKFLNQIEILLNLLIDKDKENKDKWRKQYDNTRLEYNIDFMKEDIGDLFNDVEDGFQRVSSIVRSLKLFSRADKFEDFTEYDLNDGVSSTIVIAKNEVKYFAEIEADFSDIPVVNALGNQVNQVILNIILNAVHAIKSKGMDSLGKIIIKTYEDGDYVYLSVEDNGSGMDEYTKEHIFDPFFTTKPVGVGTGLGLSIAHTIIVEKHHGDIYADTELGKGTTFTIRLPKIKY